MTNIVISTWICKSILMLIIIYLLVYLISTTRKIARDYATISSKKTIFHKLLRRMFYWPMMYELRGHMYNYCSRYSGHRGFVVEAIIRYEIDKNSFRTIFVNEGFDKLFVKALTKLEEINKFVIEWKDANVQLTTTEMLELYINETKP